MDITIHSSFLPHDDPDAALAFYRETLGFEIRSDVEYGGPHWITGGPRHHPGPRRPRRHLRAAAGQRRGRPGADRAAVRGSRLRLPRSRGQPDPHPGAALSRPAIAAMTCTDGTVKDGRTRASVTERPLTFA